VGITACAASAPVSAHADWWAWLFGPNDYEECAESAAREAKSKAALDILISSCNTKFRGRRKPNGGYSFFDSRQYRSFDIAGPNPTAKEWAFIEQEHTKYIALLAETEKENRRLEAERLRIQREAERQAAIFEAEQDRKQQQFQADLERRRQIALSRVAVTSTDIVCLYPSLPGCDSYKLTATIRNQSPERISTLAVGWVFTSTSEMCPSYLQTKHQEPVRLGPGDSVVMNITQRFDGPATKQFRYCVKVTDVNIVP
jgi:hypothetical protein